MHKRKVDFIKKKTLKSIILQKKERKAIKGYSKYSFFDKLIFNYKKRFFYKKKYLPFNLTKKNFNINNYRKAGLSAGLNFKDGFLLKLIKQKKKMSEFSQDT